MESMKQWLSHTAAAGLAVCIVTVSASAQTPANQGTPSTPQQFAVTDDPEQTPQAPRPATVRDAYWASIGGYEADTHGTGYGFFGPQYVHPFSENVAFLGSANVNYLHYEFANDLGGETNVRSPGVNVMGGLMFGTRNWFSLQAGPSFKSRRTRILDPAGNTLQSSRDTRIGANVGASLWVDPTSHNNVFGMLNYDTVDEYTWGRLAFKEQVANRSWTGDVTPYLGVEYIGQGNKDILSHQAGAFIEVAHAPSNVSVMFRAGVKRSSFESGPDKTGPWFAIGFYQSFR